jgi:hypothetical protein
LAAVAARRRAAGQLAALLLLLLLLQQQRLLSEAWLACAGSRAEQTGAERAQERPACTLC